MLPEDSIEVFYTVGDSDEEILAESFQDEVELVQPGSQS